MAKRDLEFLYEIGFLRFVDRSWKQFLGPNVANVNEHILRVVWIALYIARSEKVKSEEKILKLALVHDIGESRTGDTNPVTRQYNSQDDKKAVADITEQTVFESDFLKLYEEYKKRQTIEAKIVKDADNLDVDLEIMEQEASGYKRPKLWNKYRDVAGKHLYTKSARDLYLQIKKSDPHDWHLNAPSRFNDVEKWMK